MTNIKENASAQRLLDRIKGYENYTEVRIERGLRNDALVADLAGIPKSTFSDWKKGKSAPKVEKLQKIAKALKVNIKRLVV